MLTSSKHAGHLPSLDVHSLSMNRIKCLEGREERFQEKHNYLHVCSFTFLRIISANTFLFLKYLSKYFT